VLAECRLGDGHTHARFEVWDKGFGLGLSAVAHTCLRLFIALSQG
jgi:hypothetical protein